MIDIYPDNEVAWPETTRQLAALFQITAAIEHFYDGDLECAITLASAAEGVLPNASESESLFVHLKANSAKHSRKTDHLNFVQNWLKHGKYNGFEIDKMRITPFLAALTLWRAITKFVAVYQKETPEMEKFMVWSREIGYRAPTRRKRKQPKFRPITQGNS
jgi:Ni,Fe-hydrogenase I large subunit